MIRAVILLVFVVACAGHGVLTSPSPRPAQELSVIKLTDFNNARRTSNSGCGGTANAAPGTSNTVQLPTVAYRPGETMRVDWLLTIPHPGVADTGVRIALHYSNDDTFDQNILAGGIAGDPNFPVLPVSEESAPAGTTVSTIVDLPSKTCNYCVLQWVWASRSDGGFYVSCADIAITTTGLLPDYTGISSEVGRELPLNEDAPPSPPGTVVPSSSGGGGGGGAIVAVVIVLLVLAAAGGGYYYYTGGSGFPCIDATSSTKEDSRGGVYPKMSGAPPPVPGGGPAPPSLPQGWTTAIDPSSGRTYFNNAITGETQWDPPSSGGVPPPPNGAPPAVLTLPLGWQEARDEQSGRTYFINSATGASQWERPTNRV